MERDAESIKYLDVYEECAQTSVSTKTQNKNVDDVGKKRSRDVVTDTAEISSKEDNRDAIEKNTSEFLSEPYTRPECKDALHATTTRGHVCSILRTK